MKVVRLQLIKNAHKILFYFLYLCISKCWRRSQHLIKKLVDLLAKFGSFGQTDSQLMLEFIFHF